jgi:hypothetical protein
MVVPVNVAPQPQPELAQITKTPKPGSKTWFVEYPGVREYFFSEITMQLQFAS